LDDGEVQLNSTPYIWSWAGLHCAALVFAQVMVNKSMVNKSHSCAPLSNSSAGPGPDGGSSSPGLQRIWG